MPGMFQASVFDFDGVLVDSEGLHFAAIRDEAEALGVEVDEPLYNRVFIGFDDRDTFRAVLAMRAGGPPDPDAVPHDEHELAEICRRKQARFERRVAQGIEPLPGVRELLEEVVGRMPLAIASGATRRDIDAVLDRLGWRGRFEAIVTADDVARSKPHPRTYALAVDRLATRHGRDLFPGDCLAVEDTATGLTSARDAGLRTLGVCTTGPAEHLARADRVAPSLDGVTLTRLREWFA